MNQFNAERIYYLDNLRAFIIFLVIVLHAAISYMEFPLDWWYVISPERSRFFLFLVILIDVFIMPTMFFIAGYFAIPSFIKKGPLLFIREKIFRIGLPWIIGVLLLAPPISYIKYFSRKASFDYFIRFWIKDFWIIKNYGQAVYWFLGILLLFFIIFTITCSINKNLILDKNKKRFPYFIIFILFILITSGSFLYMSLYYSFEDWKNDWYIIVFPPVRLPIYFLYFVFGCFAFKKGWFKFEGYAPRLINWIVFCFIAGISYAMLRTSIHSLEMCKLWYKISNAFLYNAFCLSSIMVLIALFKKYVNSGNQFWKSQARSSYGVYYIHSLILYPMIMLFIPLKINLFLKAAIVIISGFLFSWIFTTQVLRRLPIFKKIF